MEFIPEEMGTEHVFKNNNGIEFHSFFFFFTFSAQMTDNPQCLQQARCLPATSLVTVQTDRFLIIKGHHTTIPSGGQ